MRFKHSISKFVQRLTLTPLRAYFGHQSLAQVQILNGSIASRQVHALGQIGHLSDVEFQVFSQWGEDGIIEWLIHHAGPMPETFVEFGVENYTESNTRFLLMHRNWRGLIIDGSHENIDYVRADRISWRHELHSVASFITTQNINTTIRSAGLEGEIGLLSVDIDGNDYWVLEAIDCVSPRFLIVEYNSAFGDLHQISTPYAADFVRSSKHYSNLYYGASIAAFVALARKKGYTFLGSNRAGSNAFFVRDDIFPRFAGKITHMTARPSLFREARDKNGHLTLLSGRGRSDLLAGELVVDVSSGQTSTLGARGELFSADWQSHLGR